MRYRVEIFLGGVWQEHKLAKLIATTLPGGFGTFPTRDLAESFIKEYPRREHIPENLRVVEIDK